MVFRAGTIVAILSVASTLHAQNAVGSSDRPPNFLWISAEDLSPDLGCYADPEAKTPNIDKLASQGARFTRAFSVTPVCAPSRSSIITGMYPTTIGSLHMRSKAVPPPHVKCFTEYLRAAGYYCTNNVKTDYNFDPPLTAWDESNNKAHWRNRPDKTQPFFAVFNHTVTHESQIRVSDDAFARQTRELSSRERHDPSRAKLPPYYPDTPIVRNDWVRYYDLITALDKQVARLLAQLEEDGLADNTYVFFWGDHGRGLPRAKRWVHDSGTRVPLLVRKPGAIAAGVVRDDLVCLMDLGPTLLSLAGLEIPERLQGRAFLGPKAGPPRDYVFAHRDRMDETYDIIRSIRDKKYRYIRNFQHGKPYAQYIDYMEQMPTMREWRRLNKEGALKGPQALFFLPEKPIDELYDVEADPHEINNLAGKPEFEAVRLRLSQALADWMTATNDVGLMPEPVLKERMRPGGVMAKTAAPRISRSAAEPGGIRIACETEGASIAYTLDAGPKARWLLYSKPLTNVADPSKVRARACRIGYADSSESVGLTP